MVYPATDRSLPPLPRLVWTCGSQRIPRINFFPPGVLDQSAPGIVSFLDVARRVFPAPSRSGPIASRRHHRSIQY
jgi:hypothetical protein